MPKNLSGLFHREVATKDGVTHQHECPAFVLFAEKIIVQTNMRSVLGIVWRQQKTVRARNHRFHAGKVRTKHESNCSQAEDAWKKVMAADGISRTPGGKL